MLETFLSGLNQWNKEDGFLDRFEEEHPIFGMVLFQIIMGVVLIGAVGGIALTGGLIIWMFYCLIGVM